MDTTRVDLPAPPHRAPDLDDRFAGELDLQRWVPAYLPHWTTPERAAARFRMTDAGIELRIDADQPDWRPEDAPMRVSNLQTGTFSGAVGEHRGTHRHREDLAVRTSTPQRLLLAPERGRVDVTLSASRDPGCMTAAWLVGSEHRAPDESGEVCIFEIDAEAIGERTVARGGIKAHHDPRLTTDMADVSIPHDLSTPHTWTVLWGDGVTVIGCEGRVVRRIAQSPDYPMLLMLDLFEIGPPAGTHPKVATIHRVRAWAA